MAIKQTLALVPSTDGDGGLIHVKPEEAGRTPARIPQCINCQRAVVPCRCRLIDGSKCGPPFYGLVHLDTNSHVCSFPLPGASMASVGRAEIGQ